MNTESVKYFDSFGVENFLQKSRKCIGNKNIITSTYRIKGYDLIIFD